MRRFALAWGLAIVLGFTGSAVAQETLVILNPANNFSDEVEPGVVLRRDNGIGPLLSTQPADNPGNPMGPHFWFACGSCEVASFDDNSVTQLGGPIGKICDTIPPTRPVDVVEDEILLCIKSTESGQLYDLNLLTWNSKSFLCVDAGDGTSCASSAGYAAYMRTPFMEATDPLDLLEQLMQDVAGLSLHKGTKKSLMAKLDGAWKKLSDSKPQNDGAAVNKLEAFVNHVEAQNGKKINEDDAEDLIAAAQAIIEALQAS